ncbi:hydrolase [Bacillus mangrovi]|uniref:Hydrolase n=1 Tax=Metabacillus mangrovi TaxID=1491830 RepID=A0A7X2V3F4_9BACI|nr:SGNH/GDSL hydrolase family protein [Metabacillus mangrovi]MTH51958.1 hydrolase [Metabacillus mangrovi]
MFLHRGLPKGKILFIGDSITDAGRRKDKEEIGKGYVKLIRDYYVQHELQAFICNKGVSGNRVTDLADRWEKDVIRENPDVVSISIGINDVWRQLDSPGIKQVLPDEFKEVYTHLLLETTEKTSARLILMEPTIIEEDLQSEGNRKLAPYITVIRDLAEKFQAKLIPSHVAFLEDLKQSDRTALTTDGVHLTSRGSRLLADTWMKSAAGM